MVAANTLGSVTFLLPILTLFIGFLILKWSALKVSIIGWLIEVLVVVIFYPSTSILHSSIWAILRLWSAFVVIWTGFLFRNMYNNTGLLERLVKTLDSLFSDKWGKAVTISGVVGGMIGAFNGYATYPVTIVGLKQLGYKGWRAASSYLVYFSSSIPFVSLWIAGVVAEGSSHVPIIELVPYVGRLTMPLVIVSTIGFARILEIKLMDRHNLTVLSLTILGSLLGRLVFTQIFPSMYLLTLIGSSGFIILFLAVYSRVYKLGEPTEKGPFSEKIKPFAPMLIGIIVILLWKYGPILDIVSKAGFILNLWGFSPVSINLLDNPGFFILVISFSSYLFKLNENQKGVNSNPLKDIIAGSKQSKRTMATLVFGSAIVGMMLNAGQISSVRNMLVQLGSLGYNVFLVLFSFGSAMVFAEGLPADFLLSSMQVGIDKLLDVYIPFLISIIITVVMGIADPLKPSLLSYTSTLANSPPSDEPKMFKTALLWELTQVTVVICEVVIWYFVFFK